MKRIVTVTRTVTHFVDVEVNEENEEMARAVALEVATDDHRHWDFFVKETPWVLTVREA